MKKIYAAFFSTVFSAGALAQQPVYFASYPTLTPDAKYVVFSYAGDLWKTDNSGAPATRLTGMQGEETSPHVSPDGKWLAFSSNQFGNTDVYVMPLAGGEIRQITFSDVPDEVDSWSADSKSVYFTSSRYNTFSSYKVSAQGGTPVRLFDNYFNTIHGVVESPATGELFFGSTWESYRFPQRKHYKGAYNPDIQSYNPATKQYKQYTMWEGKDFWATVDQKGLVYFVSDEANGEYNLYTFAGDKKTPLTRFETSVKRPQVSFNGQKIVFEKDYQLFLYDVASAKTTPLNFTVFRNNVLPKQQEFNAEGNIESFDVSPDGKKLAFISRGEIFVSDVEGKYIRKIDRGSERASEVQWLADNRTLLFNQTFNGFQNLCTLAADGNGPAKQITSVKRNNRNLILNKKKTLGLYLSGRDELCLIDLKTMKSKTLAKDEFWAIQNSQPRFSPNDDYAVFTVHRNFEQDVMVCNLKTNKITNLTNSGISETGPFWAPDGKSIFFASSRTTPSYPYGPRDPHIYRMWLDRSDKAFRSDKLNALFTEEKKPDSAKKTPVKSGKKKPLSQQPTPAAPPALQIDTDEIMERIERVSANYGGQDGPYVIQKGDKTLVYYLSTQSDGKPALYLTTLDIFDEPKTEKIAGLETSGFDMVQANGKYYLLSRGTISTFNIDNNKAEPIKINIPFVRNMDGEFKQMFDETWANLDENYYDGDFHGVNWQTMHDRYARFVPHLNTRSDLRLLLNDLLGELNSSHMGFSSSGMEEKTTLSYRTMETGIVFENNDPYTVNRVLKRSPADKQAINILPGDRLVEVNGKPVDVKTDRNAYFTQPSLMKEIRLVFDRKGKKVAVNIHPESSGEFRENLYDDWIASNRKTVLKKGNNRIAYAYMKNMSGDALQSFLEDMVQDAWQKDALILDLRYNTGGNVHDPVLQFLSQKPYLQWQYRGGKKTPQPNFGPAAKPIILLVNEQTLSDGEMTATGFKALKLGKVIGTETYRWIIFTSGKGLVDGSFYRIPAWGCFTLDGKDIEKEGVKPDIDVKTTFTDRLTGNDPQLDRAIGEIEKMLR